MPANNIPVATDRRLASVDKVGPTMAEHRPADTDSKQAMVVQPRVTMAVPATTTTTSTTRYVLQNQQSEKTCILMANSTVADIPVATKVATADNSTHHLPSRAAAATGLQVDNTAANRVVCLLLDGIRDGILGSLTDGIRPGFGFGQPRHFMSEMRLHLRGGAC
jgi:hypothetical protein